VTTPLRILRRLDGFLVAILATVAIASLLPARGSVTANLSTGTKVAIALLFFLYGARLPTREAVAGLRNGKLHLTVLASTFVLFPVLGYACRLLEPTILTPALYIGVLFLTLLPSTVQTAIAFTGIARGNVAAAICAASFSNVAGVVITPLLAALLLGSQVGISAASVLRIAAQLLLPFVFGQLVRRWIAPLLMRHQRAVSLVDRGTVLLVIYSAFSEGVTTGVWHQVTPVRLVGVLGVDAALLALVLTITTSVSQRLGLSRADRVVVIFCGSKKSIAAGIPIASLLFVHQDVSLIVLPALLYHQLQLMVCAVLARRMGREAQDDQPELMRPTRRVSPSPVGTAV
jgi:solute carrier family 10 (sodium/bile acid cotransporter), member 7